MKSFFEWFKSSTKVKRWMFLIILGIALTCYGFTKVLVNNEMDFTEIGKMFGVTSGSVRFWCKNYGLPFNIRDYKRKMKKSNYESKIN